MFSTIKLISLIFSVIFIALIISFFIWETLHSDTHPSPHPEISPNIQEIERSQKVHFYSEPLLPRVQSGLSAVAHVRERPQKSALSKFYFKINGAAPFQEDSFLKGLDAEGSMGYTFNSAINKFYATPILGYTLNSQINPKSTDEEISHWQGPFVGLNTEVTLTSFFILQAGYSFYAITHRKIHFQNVIPILDPAQKGMGHTGLLGLKFILNSRFQIGATCKYKEFRTFSSQELSGPANPSPILHTFQASGELSYQF